MALPPLLETQRVPGSLLLSDRAQTSVHLGAAGVQASEWKIFYCLSTFQKKKLN